MPGVPGDRERLGASAQVPVLWAHRLLRLLTEQAREREAIERLPKAPKLTPMQTSDAEDEITDWLEDHHIDGGWELSPTLVAAGVDADWLESRMKTAVPIDFLEGGIRWVTYALETELLMNEIEDASHRISALVGAAKQYTQVDRAAHQAMAGSGTLTVRTSRDRDFVLTEIGDTGLGVPEELRTKIFEPFFSTKPVGEGTGLGLDITYRIVVQRHGGDLSVVSAPGHTRFQVRLPLQAPACPSLPT